MEEDRSVATIKYQLLSSFTLNDEPSERTSFEFSDIVHGFITFGLDISLHSLVMIFGLYLLKQGAVTTFSFKKWRMLNAQINKFLFWSASFVLFTVNISCLVFEIIMIRQYISTINNIKNNIGHDYSFTLAFYIPPFPFMLIEIFVVLCCLRKHIGVTSHVCCISRLWFIRLVYSLAVCNIFWFFHHVANCFIVSMYFIAMAPAPTLTVIALLISFIVISIAAISTIAFTCYSAKYKRCNKICQTLLLLLMLFCLISFIMLFTLLFLIFTLHGLSASSLGTVILSLIIPFVMVVVSLVVKKYMKEVRSTTFEEYLPTNEEQEARESQPLLRDSPV